MNINQSLYDTLVKSDTKHKALSVYAYEIKKDWAKVNFGAAPYLNAMFTLNQVTDNYYQDSAKSVVLYFLANAGTWRGETAKRIKAELKELVK
jgi:hypothetical protein